MTELSQRAEQINGELFRRLGNYIDRVRLVELTSGIPPTEFTFELRVKSIGDFRNNMPVEKDAWLLSVKLPRNAGDPPQCTFLSRNNFCRPAHPHVKPASILGSGTWRDYQTHDPNEPLLDLVLRICRSLQYDPACINTDIAHQDLGNEKALNWYKFYFEQYPGNFPFDKNPIVPVLPHVASLQPVPPMPSAQNLENQGTEPLAPAIVEQTSEQNNAPTSPANVQPATQVETESSQPKKRFSISFATEPYQPKKEQKPFFPIEAELNSDVRGSQVRDELYVLAPAREDLFNHIDWTAKSPQNQVEQGGLLLGEVYFDPAMKTYSGVVERAIPARSAESSPTHISMNHNVWREMTEKIDQEMPGKQIIGWYHTHPNRLDVYMSEADLNTQRMMFPNEWQFAIILNPHSGIWRVFLGYDAKESHGFFVKKQEEEQIVGAAQLPAASEENAAANLKSTTEQILEGEPPMDEDKSTS